MLRKILAITGRPGLFQIISQGKNTLIVEDIASKKRLPVHVRDRVVSLGDIAIYTEGDDVPLGEVFNEIYKANDGKTVDLKAKLADGSLRAYLAEVYPTFDSERVHDSDIKKLFAWYNLLVQNGFTQFVEDENKETAEKEAEAEAAEEGIANE